MERGVSASAAAALLSGLALAVCVSRLVVGFALDRGRPSLVAAVTIALSAVGLALLAWPKAPIVLGAGLTGFGLGAELDLLSFFCAAASACAVSAPSTAGWRSSTTWASPPAV